MISRPVEPQSTPLVPVVKRWVKKAPHEARPTDTGDFRSEVLAGSYRA